MMVVTKKEWKNLARKLRFSSRRRHYLILVAAVLLMVILVYYLLTSSYYCFDTGIEWKVSKFCKRYHNLGASGLLCLDFCKRNVFWNFRCPEPKLEIHHPNRFQTQKLEQPFSVLQAVPNENYEKLFWVDSHYHEEHYPTEAEYENIVKRYIQNKYNMDIPFDKMRSLLRLTHKEQRQMFHTSLRDSWNLIQNHEYIMMSLFDEKDLFPYVTGNCGEMFAVEHLTAVDFDGGRSNYMKHIDVNRWRYHIKVAVLIVDYITELELYGVQMCHVDLSRFGINNNRLKYDDLRFIFTEYTINRKLSSGTPCTRHEHCSFMQCKSECNLEKNRCESTVLNNNVQIICEKIFLGTKQSPGILVTQKTSDRLEMLVQRCANPKRDTDIAPDRPLGTSEELKKILYNELTDTYEKLSTIRAP
ncbi:divergent protein kinase domain 1C [Toxorhynchites rutilus septentrionalis]|uniref:divergent protein kinase domain 1C n=1 Tax=Toxorhynchites rutilus septentrionalis TaxID=329112 RepID=UPI002478D34D|nr:divergent protein kinase domain 1C [Toxorhynchites rutilus septentrionalis]